MELRRKNTGPYETCVFEQSKISSDVVDRSGIGCILFAEQKVYMDPPVCGLVDVQPTGLYNSDSIPLLLL